MKKLRYILAFLTVRPRRWFFGNCIWRGSCGTQWLPRRITNWDNFDPAKHDDTDLPTKIEWPNIHWVIAYRTVFRFFKWMHQDAWRPFCDWTGGWRRTTPRIARVIQRIGQTTAGCAANGGECWHCGSEEGCPVELSQDKTGTTFILEREWTSSSEDGTDHRFSGTTICPKCGHREHYEDGSL